jgi:hypothetical protein
MLNVDSAIKQEKLKMAQDSIARRRTIQEMLEADSSDDEMYDTSQNTHQVLQNQFQWYQPGYQTQYDDNEGLAKIRSKAGYPQSTPVVLKQRD